MDRINRLLSEIDVLGRQGRDIEMIPLFHEAVQEARLRGDEALLARLLNDFGGVLRNTGNYDIAKDVLEEAKELVKRISGENTQPYVTTLLNAGTMYIDAQDYTKARIDLEKAYKIANFLRLDNLVYASINNNLGILNLREQRYQEAYEYQKVAMDILRNKEKSRVKLAIACSNFAETCKLLGNTAEYYNLLNEAKELLNNAVGENHPLYAMVVNNLASTFYREGRVQEAEMLLKDALDILATTYGKASKGYRSVANNLRIVQNKDQVVDGGVAPKITVNDKNQGLKKLEFRPGSGLAESYEFFEKEVYPILKNKYSELLPHLAAGLAGKGSECLGFDDQYSRDHDFECKVLIFVKAADYFIYIDQLTEAFSNLTSGNVYVIPISDYYTKYTGCANGPETMEEWRAIPEDFLATAVSGAVYFDNLGVFTEIRERLLNYYPEDLRLKHIAYHCLKLAQSGQYNYPRALKRGEHVAAMLALQEMMTHSMAIIFAFNKTYMPFYKWQHRALKQLPILGEKIAKILQEIAESLVTDRMNEERIEEICKIIIARLHSEGISSLKDTFLLPHGYEVAKRIKNKELREEDPWVK